ncbi:hypothetical protein B0T22DRAFT_180913 [Podospora appendiculata]|uniref:Microbial-type PARG catalytic domain-containing protein n=1 Tax=Podospora appendiculata TaxID=314037 RepID=A0AAE1CDQ0_9PEZI|nr:hypothetical protein B0T22DRAFT_180913 [Podospora appendiculata]
MPSSGSKSAKPKPSEVAAETKKHYIPLIRNEYASKWNPMSYIYHEPLVQINFLERPLDVSPPQFTVSYGDPVDYALAWAAQSQNPIPFICAANDKRPGGDWETGVVGYEERLCRRSTLAANLATPGPGVPDVDHYPIISSGVILSHDVVVFRGPHDRYEKIPAEQWQALPVVSVPPTRWPKLTQHGTKYSFAKERDMVKEKLRGALRVCAYANYTSIVIGDFGLGNSFRNPPQELAELWREVFLYDPDLRGRLRYVAFVFEDPAQSTAQMILDDMAKKSKSGSSSSSNGSSSSKSKSSSSRSLPSVASYTDYQIFSHVFDGGEVQRVLAQPDSRYGLNNLLAE